ESILLYMDLEGIAVSTGSACSTGSLEPSHVLMATGVDAELAHGSIRFSLGRENTEEDIAYVLEKLPPIIEKIRKMSTVYKKGETK
ncbi:MAG: aminotransferase class V-fold PLP-dependent enzyme, partial [Spirochaetia bacterium]|nr:aminotransferase class V-fold PLP-dependent enzyme [Spirochaetia bacterium]